MAPNPPAFDLREILVNEGADSNDWQVTVSREEDVDKTVTVLDSGGQDANPKWLFETPQVNVRIRGPQFDYASAYQKAYEVKDILLGLPKQTINNTKYVGITTLGDINFIAYDENSRPVLTINLQMWREPDTGKHRSTLP